MKTYESGFLSEGFRDFFRGGLPEGDDLSNTGHHGPGLTSKDSGGSHADDLQAWFVQSFGRHFTERDPFRFLHRPDRGGRSDRVYPDEVFREVGSCPSSLPSGGGGTGVRPVRGNPPGDPQKTASASLFFQMMAFFEALIPVAFRKRDLSAFEGPAFLSSDGFREI